MNPCEVDPEFEALLRYIKQNRGFDFTGYKRNSLERRVRKRMYEVGVERFGDYLDYLEVRPEEFVELFNTVLINVTSFFRDVAAWNYLAQEIIPQIIDGKNPEEPIRIWSAGCASGEEAYTIVMLLAEALGPEDFGRRVKIYATDVDDEALTQARHAIYAPRDLRSVPEHLRDKYFEIMNGRCVFRGSLRRSVIFGRHDLVQDSPISRLDLLVCRNTLMYFNAEIQARILTRFHFALRDGRGFLFLGKAEMLLTHADLFTPVGLPYRVFVKVPKFDMRDRLMIFAETDNDDVNQRPARHLRLREVLFDTAPIAQIVVDADGLLVLANAQARALGGLSLRDLSRVFHDLEISYRPVELRSLMEQAMTNRRDVLLRDIEWPIPDSASRYMDVRVVPLVDNGGGLLGVNITFSEVTQAHRLQAELERSKQELETAYEELQSTNEEMETTNEELQSTVEELETTNEELQSTNEEMETMNEELQSTNEELQTANNELHQNTEQINRTNAFLNAILAGMHSGVVVLNRDLCIEIWNDWARELWGLRRDEVEGQFFLNLDIGLPVEQLKGPLRAILDRGEIPPEVVLTSINRRGKTIPCHVTCTPLYNFQNEVDGAIVIMEEQKRGDC